MIASDLIANMFRDHLRAADEMVRLGNFAPARLELSSALETIAQLEALHPELAPPPTSQTSPTRQISQTPIEL
jgi:hypothetical protein